jgi:hypothetical protein
MQTKRQCIMQSTMSGTERHSICKRETGARCITLTRAIHASWITLPCHDANEVLRVSINQMTIQPAVTIM